MREKNESTQSITRELWDSARRGDKDAFSASLLLLLKDAKELGMADASQKRTGIFSFIRRDPVQNQLSQS